MPNKLTQLINEEKPVIINPMTDGNEKIREQVEEELKDQDFEHGEHGLITAVRFVEFAGKKFRLERTDPHGFWSVKLSKGQVPSPLQGSFTSVEQASRAVQHYANSK